MIRTHLNNEWRWVATYTDQSIFIEPEDGKSKSDPLRPAKNDIDLSRLAMFSIGTTGRSISVNMLSGQFTIREHSEDGKPTSEFSFCPLSWNDANALGVVNKLRPVLSLRSGAPVNIKTVIGADGQPDQEQTEYQFCDLAYRYIEFGFETETMNGDIVKRTIEFA